MVKFRNLKKESNTEKSSHESQSFSETELDFRKLSGDNATKSKAEAGVRSQTGSVSPERKSVFPWNPVL